MKGVFFVAKKRLEEDLRVGAVLREQNALPCNTWKKENLTAKTDVDNVGAGRAAKGANPLLCANVKSLQNIPHTRRFTRGARQYEPHLFPPHYRATTLCLLCWQYALLCPYPPSLPTLKAQILFSAPT